ncbi:MAG: choice-of-anchor J domain-containing protein [Chryseobacterium sp.]|jgi:hypothetical protein|uniref:T9SS-dependent choice-of-anchor J family protein n=1 Tax=Chryseobacterium sp. TaxID=1871047 RepID=UPI0028364C4B|nr:choice-of-anchor J domain-containing protein [Chryseobacterium sp.]MDR2237009.1 choice-of-anchor J domain-containing protein [Chryseobacterium sp.]
MIKSLFILGLMGASVSLNLAKAQTVVFQETFDTAAGWTVVDRDGDDENWGLYAPAAIIDSWGFSGTVAGSKSWDGELGPLSPDNLLVSPAITLPATGNLSLTFQVGSSDNVYFAEHYGVYILPSTATSFTGSETALLAETLTAGRAAQNKTVTIPSSFAGQSVKLYFRHFNTTDKNMLILDNVKITQTGTLATSETDNKKNSLIAIGPNPTADYLNILTDQKITNLEIYDMSGRKVNVQLDGNKVNVKHLNAGSYVVSFETKNGKTTEKFIKK